jgi:uncharacterized protein
MVPVKPSRRVEELVATLRLQPHPEGGAFRETFRSAALVGPADGRGLRSALTVIYFLLESGDCSRWHTVASDEAWHFCEGEPLELLWIDRDLTRCERTVLGPLDDHDQPQAVVPAHCWQAARPLGEYALIACTVGPGFDFADFALLRDRPADASKLRERFARYADLV